MESFEISTFMLKYVLREKNEGNFIMTTVYSTYKDKSGVIHWVEWWKKLEMKIKVEGMLQGHSHYSLNRKNPSAINV